MESQFPEQQPIILAENGGRSQGRSGGAKALGSSPGVVTDPPLGMQPARLSRKRHVRRQAGLTEAATTPQPHPSPGSLLALARVGFQRTLYVLWVIPLSAAHLG